MLINRLAQNWISSSADLPKKVPSGQPIKPANPVLVPLRQRSGSSVHGIVAEELLNAQELIVFRQRIRPVERAGLDLAVVRRHRDVGDGRVLSFAGAMSCSSARVRRRRAFR